MSYFVFKSRFMREGMCMAVTIQTLLNGLQCKYPLKLVAGVNGQKNMTQWVSMVDNNEVIPYLRGEELAITTGFALHDVSEIMEMCRNLYERGISGFILNLGPYISHVPKEVKEYCDENAFPLMVLPWEVRVIDIIHETDRIIYEDEKQKDGITELLRDVILLKDISPGTMEQLKRYGYTEEDDFTLIVMENFDKKQGDPMEKFLYEIQKMLYSYSDSSNSFLHDNRVMLVLKNWKNDALHRCADDIQKIAGYLHIREKIYIVISSGQEKIFQLGECLERNVSALQLGIKKQQHLIYYEELEVYSLLLAVEEKEQLKKFHDDILKKVQDYDEINQGHLFRLLRQYINTNGCIKLMAEMNYVHRNTINYQLKKLESIMECSLEHWDVRMKIQLALMIHDML